MTDAEPRAGSETDVLIVGAGPTGLVLALWLSHLGARVRIVDESAAPGTTSRALAVQARTLEFYRQLGLADDVVARGRKLAAVNMWVGGDRRARAPFGDMGIGTSRYPRLVSFDRAGDRVIARLQAADGVTVTCAARYLAGCDGARSIVRRSLGAEFPGGTYTHLFYVADVAARGSMIDGELHVALDDADFLAVFPLAGEGRLRLIGTIAAGAAARADHVGGPPGELGWDDVSHGVLDRTRMEIARVNWFSTYRVHHRVAPRFRVGRVFLLGDAAHVHSPVGGQGMNTGIGDAVNLSWKLAAVLHGRADARLLAGACDPTSRPRARAAGSRCTCSAGPTRPRAPA